MLEMAVIIFLLSKTYHYYKAFYIIRCTLRREIRLNCPNNTAREQRRLRDLLISFELLSCATVYSHHIIFNRNYYTQLPFMNCFRTIESATLRSRIVYCYCYNIIFML